MAFAWFLSLQADSAAVLTALLATPGGMPGIFSACSASCSARAYWPFIAAELASLTIWVGSPDGGGLPPPLLPPLLPPLPPVGLPATASSQSTSRTAAPASENTLPASVASLSSSLHLWFLARLLACRLVSLMNCVCSLS